MRSHPTAYALATMPVWGLLVGLGLVLFARSSLSQTAVVLAWAVWEGSVAHELAALAGGEPPGWRRYRFVLLVSTGALLFVVWIEILMVVSVPTVLVFLLVVGGGYLLAMAVRTRFVGAALATVEAGEPRTSDSLLAGLGMILPPVWLLVVRWRVGRLIGASTRRPNSASPAA